ncbi:MAG: mechanosensitive ion channel [Candidatus Micrarchaeota archaeon]|nr:mechanosensitive ion channel [Candidatus Micrarchaeota archaeon]
MEVTKIVYTAAVFLFAFIISRLCGRIVSKVLRPLPKELRKRLSSAQAYVIYLLAVFVALKVWDVDLGSVLLSLGAFSIAVSFATKNTIENFVSGILILLDRPFKVGDEIEVKGVKGKVEKITVRYTVISSENTKIFIPSKTIANEIVKNHGRV